MPVTAANSNSEAQAYAVEFGRAFNGTQAQVPKTLTRLNIPIIDFHG